MSPLRCGSALPGATDFRSARGPERRSALPRTCQRAVSARRTGLAAAVLGGASNPNGNALREMFSSPGSSPERAASFMKASGFRDRRGHDGTKEEAPTCDRWNENWLEDACGAELSALGKARLTGAVIGALLLGWYAVCKGGGTVLDGEVSGRRRAHEILAHGAKGGLILGSPRILSALRKNGK